MICVAQKVSTVAITWIFFHCTVRYGTTNLVGRLGLSVYMDVAAGVPLCVFCFCGASAGNFSGPG